MKSELVSNDTLDNATMDELAELADIVKATQQSKRAEAKERVAALKEEMAGLRQRRTKRVPSDEPADAEKPRKSKKNKKKNRE